MKYVKKTDEEDSFGILKGTGTHFIGYIPNNTSCCVSCDNEGVNKGSNLFTELVYTLMFGSDIITSIKKRDRSILNDPGNYNIIIC